MKNKLIFSIMLLLFILGSCKKNTESTPSPTPLPTDTPSTSPEITPTPSPEISTIKPEATVTPVSGLDLAEHPYYFCEEFIQFVDKEDYISEIGFRAGPGLIYPEVMDYSRDFPALENLGTIFGKCGCVIYKVDQYDKDGYKWYALLIDGFPVFCGIDVEGKGTCSGEPTEEECPRQEVQEFQVEEEYNLDECQFTPTFLSNGCPAINKDMLDYVKCIESKGYVTESENFIKENTCPQNFIVLPIDDWDIDWIKYRIIKTELLFELADDETYINLKDPEKIKERKDSIEEESRISARFDNENKENDFYQAALLRANLFIDLTPFKNQQVGFFFVPIEEFQHNTEKSCLFINDTFTRDIPDLDNYHENLYICGKKIAENLGINYAKVIGLSSDYASIENSEGGSALFVHESAYAYKGKETYAMIVREETPPEYRDDFDENYGFITFVHELAHLFNVCDEYLYDYWIRQESSSGARILDLNLIFPKSCANPYPDYCPKGESERCSGNIVPEELQYTGHIEGVCDSEEEIKYSVMGTPNPNNQCGFDPCAYCSISLEGFACPYLCRAIWVCGDEYKVCLGGGTECEEDEKICRVPLFEP
ncbi:hypothetical protein JXB41_05110 [Candidatus Woesearchaeota archaeon]|nr:hypothetical protein [Candidatus Woesearchaeota archaeon]